ncbi:CopG family transcriptional regulator [Candidatus Uhrbacteria bacterium]|nr:CopG family transcriptional regulator [Candidatus Uhrbacteria bacterium]
MPKTVFTTTISLPKSMAASLKEISRSEGRTTSELIREALRHYQLLHTKQRVAQAQWNEIRKTFKKVSRAGRQDISLSEFVIRDRERH